MIKKLLRKWLGIEQLQAQVNELDPSVLTPRKTDKLLTSDILTSRIKPTSGALKSMSPLERSQEDSREFKERIEHLIR